MTITWILYYTAVVHEYYCRVSHPANNIRQWKAGSPTKCDLLTIHILQKMLQHKNELYSCFDMGTSEF